MNGVAIGIGVAALVGAAFGAVYLVNRSRDPANAAASVKLSAPQQQVDLFAQLGAGIANAAGGVINQAVGVATQNAGQWLGQVGGSLWSAITGKK